MTILKKVDVGRITVAHAHTAAERRGPDTEVRKKNYYPRLHNSTNSYYAHLSNVGSGSWLVRRLSDICTPTPTISTNGRRGMRVEALEAVHATRCRT